MGLATTSYSKAPPLPTRSAQIPGAFPCNQDRLWICGQVGPEADLPTYPQANDDDEAGAAPRHLLSPLILLTFIPLRHGGI